MRYRICKVLWGLAFGMTIEEEKLEDLWNFAL
jgi:hypothetical protein